jgi:hypothetical protein
VQVNIQSGLFNSKFVFTGADGAHGSVEITAATLEAAVAYVQGIVDAVRWKKR